MCADLLREVLGRALGGREPAKTLLLRSRFGGASARSRGRAHATPTTRNNARWIGKTRSGGKNKGAEVFVFGLGKTHPDPELPVQNGSGKNSLLGEGTDVSGAVAPCVYLNKDIESSVHVLLQRCRGFCVQSAVPDACPSHVRSRTVRYVGADTHSRRF